MVGVRVSTWPSAKQTFGDAIVAEMDIGKSPPTGADRYQFSVSMSNGPVNGTFAESANAIVADVPRTPANHHDFLPGDANFRAVLVVVSVAGHWDIKLKCEPIGCEERALHDERGCLPDRAREYPGSGPSSPNRVASRTSRGDTPGGSPASIRETVNASLFTPAWLCSARPSCFRLF